MQLYMSEINKIPLLTKSEEFDIAAEICQGNRLAVEKLIVSNLRLVVKIAHDFNHYATLEDVISAGNLGLMRAAEKFDPNKAKFSSYAAWWIKQSIRRYMTRNRIVRLPQQAMNDLIKINRAKSKIGTDASVDQLSDFTGISKKTVQIMQTKGKSIISMDQPISHNTNTTVANFVKCKNILPDEKIVNTEYKRDMLVLVDDLDDRSKYIIVHRFGLGGGEPQILEELAAHFKCTRERIRQIQNIALAKMKKQIEEIK